MISIDTLEFKALRWGDLIEAAKIVFTSNRSFALE